MNIFLKDNLKSLKLYLSLVLKPLAIYCLYKSLVLMNLLIQMSEDIVRSNG
jgi:hypothetical protein